MRAHHGFLLMGLLMALLAVGCGDDDDAVAGDPDVRAAEALSRAMHFTGGELRDGAMGLATENRVELLLASDQVMHPGEDGLMPLEVDNPVADEKDGAAVLMQFGDVSKHVRVPTKRSVDGPGDLNFEFSIDDGVCSGLCADTLEIPVTLALELDGGDIGKHEKTTLKVDCSKKGSKVACRDSGKPGSSGGRDAGVDEPSSGGRDGSVPVSPGATAVVDALLDAVDDVDDEVCSCLTGSASSECLDTVGAQRPCNEAVLLAYAEGNEELLDCTRQHFEAQYDCVVEAACDSASLESCVGAGDDNWTAIESVCGTVPAGLRNGIDACGSGGDSSCRDGTPIQSDWFCDGEEDCPDGSDEQGCTPNNPGLPTSFPCGNSSLALDKVCDGRMDCPDGLDEMICVACPDGSGSYSSYNLCDGKLQCSDGSDEQGCTWPCFGGGMVKIQLVCDGTPDCADGSDESFCNADAFTCKDGEQIAIADVCDGVRDCSDGSDEAQALCGTP